MPASIGAHGAPYESFRMTRLHKSLLLCVIALGLFTLGRALLYALYPAQFEALGAGAVAAAFVHGLRFDGAVIARVFAIPLLLMVLPLRWLDRRGWFAPLAWLLWLFTVALVLLLVADIIYFEHVRRHVSYELILLRDDWRFTLHYALRRSPLGWPGYGGACCACRCAPCAGHRCSILPCSCCSPWWGAAASAARLWRSSTPMPMVIRPTVIWC